VPGEPTDAVIAEVVFWDILGAKDGLDGGGANYCAFEQRRGWSGDLVPPIDVDFWTGVRAAWMAMRCPISLAGGGQCLVS